MGVESLSEEALKVFNKGVSVEQILQAMDVLRELGINCKFGFIFFHPWTTINEIKTNISQLMRILVKYPNVTTSVYVQDLYIQYKSPLYERAVSEELLIESRPFTSLSYRFKDPAVGEIHKEWLFENKKLIMSEYGSINELVYSQLLILRDIIENK